MFASRNRRITWTRLSTKKSYGELTYVFSFLCIVSLFKSWFCIPFAARIAYTPPPPPHPSAAKIIGFRFQFQRNSWPNLRSGSFFVSLCKWRYIAVIKTMRTAKIGPDVRLLVTRKSYQPSRRVLKSCYAANLKRETPRQTYKPVLKTLDSGHHACKYA